VPEEKMAGDTSVSSSAARHAQVHIAEAPAQKKPAPAKAAVAPGVSGLDAAKEASGKSQRAADEKATAYLRADDELPGKLARIDGSKKTEAIVSAAQLYVEAVDAAEANMQKQTSLDGKLHPERWTQTPSGTKVSVDHPEEHTELNSALVLKETLDTAVAHARYTEFHAKELHDQLAGVKTGGAAPDVKLSRKYNEAVSHNLAGWRVATNNARMARDHGLDIRSSDISNLESDLTSCQEGLSRAEQLANKIAPARHQTPLEIANEARQEMIAKSGQLMEAKAQLARIKPDTREKIAVGEYVRELERQHRELVISNSRAWREALDHVPPNATLRKMISEGFKEAKDQLIKVAPELMPELLRNLTPDRQ
jgi:hypothetical protein